MKFTALSLWQPWASLLVGGKKRHETRSWPLAIGQSYPRILAIHAAKKWSGELSRLAWTEPFKTALIECRMVNDLGMLNLSKLPKGAIIGLVRVCDCWPTVQYSKVHALSAQERAFGDYSVGRWAWQCDAFYQFPVSIPYRGMQGLFAWESPPDVLLPEWALPEVRR